MHRFVALAALAATLFTASPAFARDWFVREGSSGDGSISNPFGDPWEALAKCNAGDHIHVTEGKYYGRQDSGYWVIPFPRVELYGGYDKQFKERNPWQHLTELLWKKDSKNRPNSNNRITGAPGDHSGAVIDGFVIDMDDQNFHSGDDGVKEPFQPTPVELQHPGCVIRNNVVINATADAIRIRAGVTVENNLVVNTVNWGISVVSGNTLKGNTDTSPAVIRNNTVLFTWEKEKPGAGGYAGSALSIGAPTIIDGNILAHSDNHGIYLHENAEKVRLKNNTFSMNLFSNLKMYVNGGEGVAIDDKEFDTLDEAGLKEVSNNEVKDPGLTLDKAWMDKFSKRAAGVEGQVVMDDWNKFRQMNGLPLIAKGGSAASGVAPPWDLNKALALMSPSKTKAGARAKNLPVPAFSMETAAAPQRDYKKVDLASWARKPQPVDNQPLEMVVGMGGIANPGALNSELKDYAATWLYSADGQEKVPAWYRKGTADQRVVEQNMNAYQGSGKPFRFFVVKGVARYLPDNYPKGAFVIDSIVEQEQSSVASGSRPKGRDWFVRADSKGGDGSKEKPFKDPYQALEKVESGDTIHVAAGEYYGKLKVGHWKIDTTYIALLGGYNANFTERDPWKNPTVLRWVAGSKTRGGGFTIEGEGDHTGAVIDGFVFDKKDLNVYANNGDLQVMESDKTEHITLASPGSTVRNCVFVNGAMGALHMYTAGVIENNIFMNHLSQVVWITRHNDETPTQIRNNTILFSWDSKRFGQGNTTTGSLVRIDTGAKAVIDNNILEFADNHAVVVTAEPRDQVITNNVFSHNLFSNYWHDGVVVDDKSMNQLKDAGLKNSSGNVVMSSTVPVDSKWFEVYLGRTAYVPGKVTMDDWNQLRELMGQPLIAEGGTPSEGLAPAYDWKKALELFPKNDKVKAGARRVKLPVKFEGIIREEPEYSYEEIDWPTLQKKAASYEGKRVALKVALGEWDRNPNAPGIPASDYAGVYFVGPEGADSVGLPKRAYIKKGTRYERVTNAAPGYRSGKDPEVHWIKGLVKNGEIIADIVERAD